MYHSLYFFSTSVALLFLSGLIEWNKAHAYVLNT